MSTVTRRSAGRRYEFSNHSRVDGANSNSYTSYQLRRWQGT
jgi:hypothetical protein